MQDLTTTEEAELERLETIIDRTQKSALEWAVAVSGIKAGELWRKGYASWGDYCSKRLQLTRQRGEQLASAGAILLAIPHNMTTIVANEGQIRELAKVPEKERVKVLEKVAEQAAKTNEPITAKSFRAAAAEVAPKPKPSAAQKPPIELDATGYPIPAHAVPFWHRRQEIQDLLTSVSRVKVAVERAKASSDPLFARCGNGAIADLTQAYTHISEAKPHAVCTNCEGTPALQPGGCGFCCNVGLVSEFKWNTSSRKEVKEMRAKKVARK